MESQIQQAVDIALSATTDPSLKNQAIEFINQIKSSDEGYKACVRLLVSNSNINESTKFFVFQVVDEFIPRLDEQQVMQLNESLFNYLNNLIQSNIVDAVYLRNKLSAIFSSLFIRTYLNVNPQFIKTLLKLIQTMNMLSIDYYLRILIDIHSEVADKFISRERPVIDRNNLIKDQIRVNDMVDLVNSWKTILQKVSSNDNLSSEILVNTTKIIGQYIDWMEINLFINDEYIGLIFNNLTSNNLAIKNETCNTISEVISKKMKSVNKLELINLLKLIDFLNSVNFANENLEFVENLAKLSNSIGGELIYIIEDSESTLELKTVTNNKLLELWPIILNLLAHDYDDVSQQIFPFISQYLLICKKFKDFVSIDLLSTLLNKIIIKMKYDNDDDGDDDETIEQFTEIRSKLKNFQDTLCVLNPELFVEAINIVIETSIFQDNSTDWRRFELGLFEMSNFADNIRNNNLGVPKNSITTSKPYGLFQQLLLKLINSNLGLKFDHHLVQLAFLELIIRHYNFLSTNDTKLNHRILEIFTAIGLFNANEKVQLRSWYLFFRFIKLTKPTLDDVVIENLINSLSPLLVVKAELPIKDEDSDIVENGNFDNQLYLFESLGLIINLLDSSRIQLKLRLIDLVFQPLFNELQECIGINNPSQLVVLQCHHILMTISTFTKGMDYELNLKYSPEVSAKIHNAGQVVVITLEKMSKFESVRDAARFSFARFIPILKTSIKAELSKLISIFISSDLGFVELGDFISFVSQIIHNFNKDYDFYFLLDELLTPLIEKIFKALNNNGENNEFEDMPDVIRDKISLQKSYINLLISISQNNVTSLLITGKNKSILPIILESLFSYSVNLTNPQVSKLAVIDLANIVNVIGTGTINDKLDTFGAGSTIEGIDSYLLENVINLIFQIPFQLKEFNIRDAEHRSIGQELSALLKGYYLVKENYLVEYLTNYLTNMGLSGELTNEFVKNLVSLDVKGFKKFFITFITNVKGK